MTHVRAPLKNVPISCRVHISPFFFLEKLSFSLLFFLPSVMVVSIIAYIYLFLCHHLLSCFLFFVLFK